MSDKKIVSILGCGWIGLPLASHLITLGYEIKGSTTSDSKINDLNAKGIKSYLIKLTPDVEADDIESFLNTETLVINIPPAIRRLGADFHPQQIKNLISYIQHSSIRNIIYVSSTSVYPNSNREVNEDEVLSSPSDSIHVTDEGNQTLLKTENIVRQIPDVNVTILRPGGLIGEDRIPGKYVAGKQGLTTGAVPVNYIHPVDLVRIMAQVIEQNVWGDVFNVVAPMHPSRCEVYAQNAKDFGLQPPQFAEDRADYKIINGDKIVNRIGYSFIYPDPLKFRFRT